MKLKYILLLTTLLISTFAPAIVFAQDEVPYGPWVDEIRFESGFEEPILFEKLQAGDMHLYCKDWTDMDLLEQIKASSELEYQTSFGLNYDLTFNPIGPTFPLTGKFNPFSNRKIRVAMNILVDRDYVVDEIMKGLAVPKYIPIVSAFPDYGRLAETAVLLETMYKHDTEAATATITAELEGMGAEKIDGKWTYDGEVITLKVLIRTEDQRLQIGDYAADLMEELGFETERDYRTSAEAAPIWLFGDPADGLWHIYTGGWISTVISRDDADVFAGYYTDMGYSVPLWQAYENDPKFYDMADRLNSGDYSTWEERMELMRKCALLALEDSNRIFLVDQLSPFVSRQDIDLAFDLSGGFSNPIWALTVRKEGEIGGVITVGSSEILVQPWNPEEGTNWLYDSIIIECLIDRFPHVYNPYTGLPMPHRMQSVTMEAEKGVPTSTSSDWLSLSFVDKVTVPTDAWLGWDTNNQNFTFVEEGTTAKVKVAVNYGDCIGNWKYHDGSEMSLADWIVPWIIDYAQADPDNPLYDPATIPEFNSEKSSLKGTKIVSESPLIIEYYTDYITREAEFIYEDVADRCGINARQYAQYPWQSMAIGIKAEADGLLAFSADKSEELDVEWMNYIGGPSLPILENILQEAMDTEWIPFENVLKDYVSSEDIQTRYQNLKDWYDDKGHFKVASGQFYLDQVDFVGHSAVIKAFRDYPFKADKFSRLAAPPIPVSSVNVPENIIPSLGAIINYDLTYEGEPYSNDRMELAKYMVLDSIGNVLTVGNAEPIAEGEWIIGLDSTETARMTAGAYNLVTIALSKDVAMPGVVETPFVVMPDLLSYVDALLAQRDTEFDTEIAVLESSLMDNTQALGELKDSVDSIEIPSGIEELESKISSLNTTTYAALAVAVIAVLVAAYGFISKK